MRRPKAIRLTLLPLLASASLARAQQEPAPQWGAPDALCDGTDPSDPDCDRERWRAEAELFDTLPSVVEDQYQTMYMVLPSSYGRYPMPLRHGFGYYFWSGG